jgi:hypothetical protein
MKAYNFSDLILFTCKINSMDREMDSCYDIIGETFKECKSFEHCQVLNKFIADVIRDQSFWLKFVREDYATFIKYFPINPLEYNEDCNVLLKAIVDSVLESKETLRIYSGFFTNPKPNTQVDLQSELQEIKKMALASQFEKVRVNQRFLTQSSFLLLQG